MLRSFHTESYYKVSSNLKIPDTKMLISFYTVNFYIWFEIFLRIFIYFSHV